MCGLSISLFRIVAERFPDSELQAVHGYRGHAEPRLAQ